MCCSRSTWGSPVGVGGRLTTKPPFAPTGTMTAFLTSWALTRPRISVRKSSGRSDQRGGDPVGDAGRLRGAAVRIAREPVRIELGREQFRQIGRDLRVSGQHLL